jgi:hypothetical protein
MPRPRGTHRRVRTHDNRPGSDHTEPVTRNIPDPTGGWADGRSPYLWDKELDGVLRVVRGVARPDLRRREVRRAMVGLVFVVAVFVVVPIVAMLAAAN